MPTVGNSCGQSIITKIPFLLLVDQIQSSRTTFSKGLMNEIVARGWMWEVHIVRTCSSNIVNYEDKVCSFCFTEVTELLQLNFSLSAEWTFGSSKKYVLKSVFLLNKGSCSVHFNVELSFIQSSPRVGHFLKPFSAAFVMGKQHIDEILHFQFLWKTSVRNLSNLCNRICKYLIPELTSVQNLFLHMQILFSTYSQIKKFEKYFFKFLILKLRPKRLQKFKLKNYHF